jgi:hypothetical protein
VVGCEIRPKLDDDVAAGGKGKGQAVVGHFCAPYRFEPRRFRRARALAPDSVRQ